MDKHQRPRTKKLERPTPNLKHPIINNKKSKELDSEIKECIEAIDKCQTNNCSTKSSKVLHNSSKTSALLYQTREHIPNDKLSAHQIFSTNNLSIIRRNKSGNKSQSIQREISRTDPNKGYTTGTNTTRLQNKPNNYNRKSKTDPKIINQNMISNNSIHHSIKEVQINEENGVKREGKERSEENIQNTDNEGSDQAGWEHFKAQLIPCSLCLRTFFPHRLAIHERSCRGIGIAVKKGIKSTQEYKVNVKINLPIMSTFLECTTCGRRYSTNSLTLHELKCRISNSSKRLGTVKNENTNEMSTAWEHFKTQLVPCSKCNRKFLADRLEKHEPNCKASPVDRRKTNDN